MADDITTIPSARSTFLNNDGTVNRVWYKFLSNLFFLLGSGTSSITTEDLQLDPMSTNPTNIEGLLQELLVGLAPSQTFISETPDVSPYQPLVNEPNADFDVSPSATTGTFSEDVVSTSGNLVTQLPGKGLRIKEGTNAKMGRAVLVAGTVTVSTTAVSGTSEIFLTNRITGGGIGSLSVGTVTAGTSFVINSTNLLDTSTVCWLIVDPA